MNGISARTALGMSLIISLHQKLVYPSCHYLTHGQESHWSYVLLKLKSIRLGRLEMAAASITSLNQRPHGNLGRIFQLNGKSAGGTSFEGNERNENLSGHDD